MLLTGTHRHHGVQVWVGCRGVDWPHVGGVHPTVHQFLQGRGELVVKVVWPEAIDGNQQERETINCVTGNGKQM